MVTYCPHCAASNEYSLAKPTSCLKCGKAFAAAFKIRIEDVSDFSSITSARKRPTKVYDSDEFDETDDPREREALRREIVAKLRASGGIRVSPAARNSIKIGELCNDPGIIDQFQNPTAAPDGQS